MIRMGKRERLKKNNRVFSKVIVSLCIFFILVFAILTYAMAYTRSIEMNATLGILVGFFGSELMLLALKDIFRKPDKTEEEKQDIERDC